MAGVGLRRERLARLFPYAAKASTTLTAEARLTEERLVFLRRALLSARADQHHVENLARMRRIGRRAEPGTALRIPAAAERA